MDLSQLAAFEVRNSGQGCRRWVRGCRVGNGEHQALAGICCLSESTLALGTAANLLG